jgi:hypothetical protein
MTPAMQKALSTAAAREKGTICPIKGLHVTIHAAAQTNLINAMVMWITTAGRRSSRIVDAGR